MQRHLIILLIVLASGSLKAQSLKKYAIGNSGCSAYFFCDPGTFTRDKSPDSSDVYTGECSNDDVSYGAVCVKLKEKITDLQAAEDMLAAYMDYLKGTLNITSAVGYGKGHRLKGRDDTRGMIDYWKDKDANNWKVKGWTDGKYLAVMFVYSKKELAETKTNVFLEGLVLPANQ